MLLPVIMAGGTGSRLWPMSRELYPKQFLRLFGQNSMLQETITRLSGLEIHEPMVICNEEHRFLVAEQLRQLNKLSNNIILEPVGRNTAPAIALAALQATRYGDDPLMLVLAADHIINNQSAFHDAIRVAEQYADEGHLVTFGIVPNAPETGYGYIQRGVALTCPFRVPGGPLCGEAGSRARRGLPRLRGVLLEQRHVYVPRQEIPHRAGQIPSGYPGSLPGCGECRR